MAKKKETSSEIPVRKTAPAAPRRRTRMIALEPRMLFDGALGVDLGAKATAAMMGDTPTPGAAEVTHAPAATEAPADKAVAKAKPGDEVLDAAKTPAERREIVFVDTSVQDYETLIADVNPNATVVLLDPARDGIAQILDRLSSESHLDAIHIVSHGSAGTLQLGATVLDGESMRGQYAQQLAQIGQALSGDADILIYGCDFGKGEAGQDAAMRLAYLTGADVAASDDITGHVELGGDWDLEVAFGQIETEKAFGERALKTFRQVLATLDWDTVDWTTNATRSASRSPEIPTG
jgi:hypothetical protein